jgi:hypothetical protein
MRNILISIILAVILILREKNLIHRIKKIILRNNFQSLRKKIATKRLSRYFFSFIIF